MLLKRDSFTYDIAKGETKSEVFRELMHVVKHMSLLVLVLNVEIVDFLRQRQCILHLSNVWRSHFHLYYSL